LRNFIIIRVVGVDVFQQNSKGMDSYDFAKFMGYTECEEYLATVMNKILIFQERKNIMYLRYTNHRFISKIPQGPFKSIISYI
jgi:hypothetical protein